MPGQLTMWKGINKVNLFTERKKKTTKDSTKETNVKLETIVERNYK